MNIKADLYAINILKWYGNILSLKATQGQPFNIPQWTGHPNRILITHSQLTALQFYGVHQHAHLSCHFPILFLLHQTVTFEGKNTAHGTQLVLKHQLNEYNISRINLPFRYQLVHKYFEGGKIPFEMFHRGINMLFM